MQQVPTLTLDCPNPGGKGTHQMAYVDWQSPTAKKTMVCVHGLTRNGRDFDYLAQEIGKDYRVLAPDMAGRGKSEWLKDKSSYHYGTYVADMITFFDKLQLKDVSWVGTSMGGLIGMVMAATYPEYVKKLVMNDIGPFIPESALKRLGEYVGKEVSFDTIEDAEKYMEAILAPWGITDRWHWRHIAEDSFRPAAGKLVLNYDPDIKQAFFAVDGDLDMWDLWAQVKCPVLVLRGGNSDLLTSATAERMKNSRPNVEVVEFPNIGHAPALMAKDQISKVKAWLDA